MVVIHKGDCDVCRKVKGCKLADAYIRRIVESVLREEKIEVCKEWRS